MENTRTSDWQPEQYLKFRNERTQPSIDLVQRIALPHPRRILDIGCGPGNSTAVLKARWPAAEVTGLDSSAAMIERARTAHPDIAFIQRSATADLSDLGAFDLVFSNAAFQWIPDNKTLVPKLFGMVAPGGALAAQVPFVRELPLYTEIIRLAGQPRWQPLFAGMQPATTYHSPRFYYDLLCTLTPLLWLWQTDYYHVMQSHAELVEWYRGTGLRPYLDYLPDDAQRLAFREAYGEALAAAYPTERDGNVLLPFRRVFMLAQKQAVA